MSSAKTIIVNVIPAVAGTADTGLWLEVDRNSVYIIDCTELHYIREGGHTFLIL